jgi:hypothetical protein
MYCPGDQPRNRVPSLTTPRDKDSTSGGNLRWQMTCSSYIHCVLPCTDNCSRQTATKHDPSEPVSVQATEPHNRVANATTTRENNSSDGKLRTRLMTGSYSNLIYSVPLCEENCCYQNTTTKRDLVYLNLFWNRRNVQKSSETNKFQG